MSYLSHRRVLPAALAACLALGLGSTAASAASAGDASARGAQARRGRGRARRPAPRRSASRTTSKGGAFLNGSSAPGRRVGSVGDFYVRTSNRTLYGPKTRRGWGSPVSLVGPTGAPGPQGAPGANGAQGPVGTPAFANGVVTTIAAPATLTGVYDEDGYLVSPFVEVGTVSVPAGVSLLQLRTRVTPGAGFATTGSVMCETRSATSWVLAGYGAPGQLAFDTVGWTTYPLPTTLAVYCAVGAPNGGTRGTTVSASVAGTQAVVFQANVPVA